MFVIWYDQTGAHAFVVSETLPCTFVVVFLQTAHGVGKNRTAGHVGLRDNMVDETRVFEAVSGDNTAEANDVER